MPSLAGSSLQGHRRLHLHQPSLFRLPVCPPRSLRGQHQSLSSPCRPTNSITSSALNHDPAPSSSYSHFEPAWRQPARLHVPMRQRHSIARRSDVTAAAASLGSIGRQASRQLQQLWQWLEAQPFMRYKDIIFRTMITLLMLVIIRLGYYIALPGLDMAHMPTAMFGGGEGEMLIKALYGQASELPASIFDLGISPFVNAQIVMFFLLMMPEQITSSIQWWNRLKQAKKQGKQGEAEINMWVHGFAFFTMAYLGILRAFELESYALVSQGFILQTCIVLMAGACILQYCANAITSYGIGNGTTLVIVASIVSEYASTLHQVMAGFQSGSLGLQQLAVGLGGYLFILLLAVLMNLTELRLPMVHYSRIPAEPKQDGAVDSEMMFLQARQLLDRKAAERGAQPTYYPIMLNTNGMMAVIFAGSLWFFLWPKAIELLGLFSLAAKLYALHQTFTGLFVYGLLVFLMEFITPAAQAEDTAEYMGQINMGIKGVPPGAETVQHLKQKFRQVKFWGGIAMAFLAVVAYMFDQLCREHIGSTLATTSTLILVSAVLQTSRQVESLLQAPMIQKQVEEERAVIQSLSFM